MNNKRAIIFIAIISIVVIGLVGLMYSGFGCREYFDSHFPNFDKSQLPFINAVLNTWVCISLLYAFKAIKAKQIPIHRRMIILAGIFSTLFLLNYVFYHMIADSTKYGGDGILKGIYFFILATHILLAVVSFPFILFTAFLGHTMQVELHRKFTKIVFPVWLYVAFTGVLVYIMISPYYH